MNTYVYIYTSIDNSCLHKYMHAFTCRRILYFNTDVACSINPIFSSTVKNAKITYVRTYLTLSFSFPYFPRSDAFVISVVALFSVSSGYLTVLIYEFASVGQDKRTQATATALLNLSFQVGYGVTVTIGRIRLFDSLLHTFLHSALP